MVAAGEQGGACGPTPHLHLHLQPFAPAAVTERAAGNTRATRRKRTRPSVRTTATIHTNRNLHRHCPCLDVNGASDGEGNKFKGSSGPKPEEGSTPRSHSIATTCCYVQRNEERMWSAVKQKRKETETKRSEAKRDTAPATATAATAAAAECSGGVQNSE